jgi:uncharacterized protein (TIGR02466 family)
MEIIVPFIELIYKTELKELQKNNIIFYNEVIYLKEKNNSQQNWDCDTFNHSFVNKNLIEKTTMHVKKFAEQYGITNKKIECTTSWINLAQKNHYQEYHIHPLNHFSAVYYVKVPQNSGKILFKNHSTNGNMFPIVSKNLTQANYQTYSIKPNECDLLIFRSNLQHMVEKNNSDKDRVSISMNFKIDD